MGKKEIRQKKVGESAAFVKYSGRPSKKAEEESAELAEWAPGFTPPTWKKLVAMAELAMDEANHDRTEEVRERCASKQKYMFNNCIEEEADVAGLRRGLLEYYCEVVASVKRNARAAFASVKANYGELFGGVQYRCFDIWVVWAYIRKIRGDMARELADESAAVAQDAQLRLITEEGCDLNQRAVEVSLKATMRDVYGDSTEAGAVKDGKAAITYNFPNMTLNWIVAPGAMRAAAEGRPELGGAAGSVGYSGAAGAVLDAEAAVEREPALAGGED